MAVSFILEQTVESEKDSEKWKRNEAKRLRASGEGKLPPEPSRLCSNSCRLKCNAISADECNSIHSSYHELDTDAKNAYLFVSVQVFKPKTASTSTDRPRSWSFGHHIMPNGT